MNGTIYCNDNTALKDCTHRFLYINYGVFFHREGEFLTKWMIGLVFVRKEGVSIDLTYDIQNFIDTGKMSIKHVHECYKNIDRLLAI